jgi:tetratricopeptide (TPR) repeat protein
VSSALHQWLETLGLAQYGERFAADDLDLDVLPSLSEQDLEKLGVSMGHRKKLLKAIAELSTAPASPAAADMTPLAPSALSPRAYTPKHLVDKILQSKSALEGERKQVTGLAGHQGMLGRVEAALALGEEVVGMLNDGMDTGVIFLIETVHAYWLAASGRIRQAIEAFDRIVERSGGDPHVGRELIGYSPLIWAEFMAAWMLAQAGRFDECWPRVEHAIRMGREHGAQENLGWALGGVSACAYFAGGTSRVPVTDVCRASLEGVEIAEAGGSRFSQIFASCHLATAHFLSGDYRASEERFAETLAEARSAGTALDWQGYYLAVLADSCLARGDVEAAIARAREGIVAADAGGSWLQAALARAVLVDALLRADAPEHEIAAVITEAHELVRKSGGNSLLPRLREAEARLAGRHDRAILATELREAETMYRAIGAPDPADRLARELAAGR